METLEERLDAIVREVAELRERRRSREEELRSLEFGVLDKSLLIRLKQDAEDDRIKFKNWS